MTPYQIFTLLSIVLSALMWTLVGQGILRWLLGARADDNIVYRFFSTITHPVIIGTRFVTPRFVVDAHIGLVAFFLLLLLRLILYMVFHAQGWLPSLADPSPVP